MKVADDKGGKKKGEKKQKKIKGTYYDVSGEGLKRGKRACPKCGSGVFMAEHKDRFSCGRCSFTEMKGRSVPSPEQGQGQEQPKPQEQ